MTCVDTMVSGMPASDETSAARREIARRLGVAVRRVREGARLSGAELGRLIGKAQGIISQWESGEKQIQLLQIEQIEDVLSLTRGTILAEAGFVALPSAGIRAAIAGDDELSPIEREQMVQQYDLSWRRSHASSDGHAIRQHVEDAP